MSDITDYERMVREVYEATSEVTGKRVTGCFTEDELIAEIDSESVSDDFWDVFYNGHLAYYYAK